MKILFASLMCLILGASECFAIAGGPVYPGSTNLVGTYAGVLQGTFDPTNPTSSNSVGVFSLGVPSTGSAKGPFVMFARGRMFSGTIQGTADPNKSSIKGILAATFNFTISQPTTDSAGNTTILSIPVTATVNGSMNANVTTARSSGFSSVANTILRGGAILYIEQGRVSSNGDPIIDSVLSLSVSGFKQSNTAVTGG